MIYCATNNIYYFISIMCIYNAQPIITLLLLCFHSLNFTWIYIKELTVQVPSKKSCVCYSRLSGTNWAYVDHVQTQASFPPPPTSSTPICLQSLTRDIKRTGVGRGRSRCWSSPVSCAPTEFSHGSDPSNMLAPPAHLMGHPSLERTPLSEPQSQRCPCLDNNGAWGGGGLPRRGDEASQGRCTWILPTFLFG